MKSLITGWTLAMALGCLAWAAPAATAQQSFKDKVGPVTVGPVAAGATLAVPYITWGGDMVTFYANGGLATKPGSIFDKQGLKLKLTPGDDFIQQVRDYESGKTPLLRGTFHMIGMASEAIGSDPRTKGVVILQLTWSAGDHMIARANIKTVADLKGKTICLQEGGPHVGMLNDVLKTAQLSWNDVKIVWAKDLTGSASSPAEMFRKDPSIDACFAISPDMISLTGGLQNVGSGAEGTVKGARVLVSTAELSRSIADVYVCRKDYYDTHKAQIEKFVAGYLKACEEVVDLKKAYEASGSAPYTDLLKMTQQIYGAKTIATLDDAHGLLSDCTLVGYPGNVAFFTDPSNPNGFQAFEKSALDLAVNQGYASIRAGLIPSDLNYQSPTFTTYLTRTTVAGGEHFRPEIVQSEIEQLSQGGQLDARTIVAFTINFEPNQTDFPAEQYGAEYQRLVEMAQKYGNAVFAIRGHSDPTKTLLDLLSAGMAKGVIQRSGTTGNYSYSFSGRPLDLAATKDIVKLIETGQFANPSGDDPRQTMLAAQNLSLSRAEAVRASIIAYAKSKGLQLDPSQIQPVGAGISEPFIAKPRNMDEAKKNMRVEFRLLRVNAEAIKPSDFNF